MNGCKIIDFCLQKSIEIVGIHSIEANYGVARKHIYVSIHLLHPVVTSLHPLVIPVYECIQLKAFCGCTRIVTSTSIINLCVVVLKMKLLASYKCNDIDRKFDFVSHEYHPVIILY